jgi:hypothetical protein
MFSQLRLSTTLKTDKLTEEEGVRARRVKITRGKTSAHGERQHKRHIKLQQKSLFKGLFLTASHCVRNKGVRS